MILGFSSVCEGLFTHTGAATVARGVYRDVPDALRLGEAVQVVGPNVAIVAGK